jgi:hypothetical protein
MGEGGGFPRVRAMVSQVSPRSPVVSHTDMAMDGSLNF